MKKKHRRRPTRELLCPESPNSPERFDLIGDMEAVSAQDQTGLVASAPQNEYEYKSYNDILSFEEKYLK